MIPILLVYVKLFIRGAGNLNNKATYTYKPLNTKGGINLLYNYVVI